MAKFNTQATTKTVNHEGHVAYDMTQKAKLVTQVLTSFINEKKFYGDNTEDMFDTIRQVIKADPQFVSKLAVFARREFNMRSVAHVLTGFLANANEGKPYVRETVRGITLRGDDATELMAFYLNTFGKPIPNILRRSLRDVIAGFDAYTLSKYKGENDVVKMRDLFRICRPKPATEEQSALWKQLMDGTIPTAYTWESELSAKGNTKETWEELIASGKVGYMALLRNLRNIINAGPDNFDTVLNRISDPGAVKKSRQLPFRFLSAYKNLPDGCGSRVRDALEDAVEASVENLPKLPGKTVIAIDVSGSMGCKISDKSEIRSCEIALMLGLIANKICEDAVVYEFDHMIAELDVSKKTGILYACVHDHPNGGGTNMYLPFEKIEKDKVNPDRVIVISDNEVNHPWYPGSTVQSLADRCRKNIGKDFWVHGIDTAGYGTQQFSGKNTNIIAGWSEKVFDFILLAEQGEGTLEKRIASYTW